MSSISDLKAEANDVYRDTVAPGSSLPNDPAKTRIRSLMGAVLDKVEEVGASAVAGRRVFATLAERGAWTDRPTGAVAYVEATDETYRWSGAAWEAFEDPTLAAAEKASEEADRAESAKDLAQSTAESLGALARRVLEDAVPKAHVFTDADGRLLASISQEGELDFIPSSDVINRVSVVKSDDLDSYLMVLTDAEGKVVWGVDAQGESVPQASGQGAIYMPDAPIGDQDQAPRVRSTELVIHKLNLNTTAEGRDADPDIVVAGDGLTHPKMICVPAGWNGYKYWLACTPTFGVIPTSAYENPHVFASNDLIDWVEPSGGRLDRPDEGNGSYWSDTHLALDDDGWLYCFYRGPGIGGKTLRIVYRRSRDGRTWSDAVTVLDIPSSDYPVDTGTVSQAIYKHGAKWQFIDVVRRSGAFDFPPVGYATNRAVFRRASDFVGRGYEPYSYDQCVDYAGRPWGEGNEPWHIDAISVGNLHLHLINTGPNGASTANELWLAWSADGWNFTVLPRLLVGAANVYRSSISLAAVNGRALSLDLIVARTTGQMDLYKLTLEIN